MDKKSALEYLDTRKKEFYDFSDRIWETPELGFQEVQSSKQYIDFLKNEGFTIDVGVGGMPTAFIAEYGTGNPVIAFLAEYDALPGLSQEAGIASPKRREGYEDGHGCGHNLLGTAMLASSVAVKHYLEQEPVSGTVRIYGTPAEEGGASKGYMVRDGFFKDVDVALSWHPDNMDYIVPSSLLATILTRFRYDGVSAHAAMCPHHGRSALDAVTLLNVGAQFLREHVTPDIRIHFAITNSGGMASNVVQKEAEAVYQVRAPRLEQCKEVLRRLKLVAEGAAMMTETTLTVDFKSGMAEVLPNHSLEQVIYRNFEALGSTPIDKEDMEFADEIRKTLSTEQLSADIERVKSYYGKNIGSEIAQKINGKSICDFIFPHVFPTGTLFGSTDVGDVSQVVPTALISTACFAQGTPNHSWQIVAQGKTPLAHKAMLHAGKVLAASAIDLIEEQSLLEAIQKEFDELRGGSEYIPIIPADKKPC